MSVFLCQQIGHQIELFCAFASMIDCDVVYLHLCACQKCFFISRRTEGEEKERVMGSN